MHLVCVCCRECAGDVPLMVGLNPVSGAVQTLINLQGKIDPGQKKIPKIYSAAVHPTK
jgi:hypothetical protein